MNVLNKKGTYLLHMRQLYYSCDSCMMCDSCMTYAILCNLILVLPVNLFNLIENGNMHLM